MSAVCTGYVFNFSVFSFLQSYVQTGATTPNIVGSCCVRFGSGVQTDATTPNNTQQDATRCVNGRNM